MRTLILALTIAALTAGTLVTTAPAKGPFDVEVSGGDLAEPVRLGVIDSEPLLSDGMPAQSNPLPYPENIYTLKLIVPDDAGKEHYVMTLTYYPAHDGMAAALHYDGNFYSPSGEFQARLDGANLRATPTGDGGTSLIWYLLPAMAAGLVLVGSGFAGRNLLRRRAR